MQCRLQTERIKLVKPGLELVAEVTAAITESRAELEEYLHWVPAALEEPEKNMEQAISNHENFSSELRYYIVDQSSSEVVGTIGLLLRDISVPFFEIGYWVRTSQVGKGYMAEALSLLEAYAFQELKAKRIEIRMAKSNVKSAAVAVRAGYKFEAELMNERRLPNGVLMDTLIYRKCEA